DTGLDAMQRPLVSLPGNISSSNKLLTAGPGSLLLTLPIAGVYAPLSFSSARLSASVGMATTPTTNVSGTFRGHLASENLDPSLQSFETTGMASVGNLCGNVSAASLSMVPIPTMFVPPGATACEESYTAGNTLLDLIVGGCRLF